MLKTKIKEALLEASIVQEAVKLGTEKAEQKLHEKKSLMDSAREHLGKMIDRIDPLEALALGVATYAIHSAIVVSQPVLAQAKSNLSLYSFNRDPDLSWTIYDWASKLPLGLLAPKPTELKPDTKDTLPQDSLMLWVVAFLIAFVLIRYGAEIINAIGGFSKMALLFLV